MGKNKDRQNSRSGNKQDKLKNAVDSVQASDQNQNHNVRKEALGPNTKR